MEGLTFSEVSVAVAALPEEALVILRKGPLPGRGEFGGPIEGEERYDCRVCEALDELEDTNPEAARLLRWHDVLDTEFLRMMEIVRAHRKGTLRSLPGEPNCEAVAQEMDDLSGACAYARCTTIYALAQTVVRT